MINNNSLGEKIRKYRLRSGKSQFQLEMEIGMSPGSISRVENGVVNPTKETIYKIVDCLHLIPMEAADIFDINLNDEFTRYTELVIHINHLRNLKNSLNVITNDLIKYVQGSYSVIFVKRDNKLKVASLNVPLEVRKLSEVLIGSLDSVSFDLSNKEDCKNFYVKSLLDNVVVESENVFDFTYPLLSKDVSRALELIANVKFISSYPLVFNNFTVGVLGLVFTKKVLSDYEKEITLNFSRLVAEIVYNLNNFHKNKLHLPS